ncbi:MAG: NIF family HAD-type phosphatase [Spirochaetota bacterium]
MITHIVFDMDNTLVDEFGSTVRPGMVDFLSTLKNTKLHLHLWTNSTKLRAKEILLYHKLHYYFDTYTYREDYDPLGRGIHKDIRKIGGQLLIDDDPAEIEFARKIGCKGYLIKPYRKNSQFNVADYRKEYDEIIKMIMK